MTEYEKKHIERLYETLKSAEYWVGIAKIHSPLVLYEAACVAHQDIKQAIAHHESYYRMELPQQNTTPEK